MGDNQNSNDMDIDSGTPGQNEYINDHMIALLAQQQELELIGNSTMNPQDIANFEKKFREYQQNMKNDNPDSSNGTENDEEIARIMQQNYIREQEMLNMLRRNDPAMIPKSNSNSNKINGSYHNAELQKQYHERYVKEKLSHEYFRSKLASKEATPIRTLIKDFYVDFEQKTNSVFQNPDEQGQYLRSFLTNISRVLIENPLWANSDKEEKENAIIEMEKVITKKLFDITYGPPDDLERDTKLAQKIHMHSWVEPRHLDLPDFDYHIFDKAGNELQKMNLYKFYIDKFICVVNCVKLIEDAYQKNVSDKEPFSSDKLLPLLIFVILKTNPKKLVSNVQYIVRYVNPNLLSIGLYEYSLTSIWGSITYIEKMTQTSLTITSEEYDAKLIEMTNAISDDKINESGIDDSLLSDATNPNNGGLLQSVMGFFFGNENGSNNEGDMEYQGIFQHLDSVKSVNRNGSSLSSNSILVNDYRKELREKYFNTMNEPITRPFQQSLNEKEQEDLVETDEQLKASLSISSNRGGDDNKEKY